MQFFKNLTSENIGSVLKNKRLIAVLAILILVIIFAILIIFKRDNSASGSVDKITQTFVAKGVKECEARLKQVNGFFTKNSKVGGVVFVNKGQEDDNIISSSLEILDKNKTISYLSATFAPNDTKTKCGAVYDLTKFWSNNCKDVAVKAYGAKGKLKILLSKVIMFDLTQNSKVFFIPIGKNSCLSVKKEILY